MIIFPDLPNVEVERVEVAEEITLTLRTTSPTASCRSCGAASSRIQSRYTRMLHDLPSVGRPIRLIMHVRRFFCKKRICTQKIFTERLPELCHPHAQRTKRLQEERETLRQLRQASPHLEAAYHLVETFLQMVRQRTGEHLDAWLAAVKASHLEAFESFVTGVQQDKDAVLAGLTLEWSSGPLEGNVNRLKLIKRSMYGRAEIDLLKLRVLYHSKKGQDRKNKRNKKQQKSLKNSASSLHATTTEISQVA